ncbi:hypothetical protein CQW23_00051 [Capsicum baccatum]|uniref:SnoaL-like domain-containing protein n=1 Tax=Capsicum baccatum TaxID=33114 RepID=A0A2G2XJL0_CAPBA|nr:hypothetical protein CQW23_00051 [Capsicum baccatum]
MVFSGQLLQHSLWSNPRFTRTPIIPPLRANHESVKRQSPGKLKIRGIKNKTNCLVTFSMLNPENGTSMSTFSPADTIKLFYSSINNKDMNQLALLISENCFYEDFSYTEPFRGRQEILKFLGQLTTCMGKNTEYSIEHIYEGVDLTVMVNWHLEWNKKQVPFTRGCSCYELSRDGEELVIRKAQVIVESPIKPGSLAMEAFQKVISVCDAFPAAADCMPISFVLNFFTKQENRNILNRAKKISYAGFFLMGPQLITSYSHYTTWLNYMSTVRPWIASEDQESNSKE